VTHGLAVGPEFVDLQQVAGWVGVAPQEGRRGAAHRLRMAGYPDHALPKPGRCTMKSDVAAAQMTQVRFAWVMGVLGEEGWAGG
jgi:hypothetical protein